MVSHHSSLKLHHNQWDAQDSMQDSAQILHSHNHSQDKQTYNI